MGGKTRKGKVKRGEREEDFQYRDKGMEETGDVEEYTEEKEETQRKEGV